MGGTMLVETGKTSMAASLMLRTQKQG